MRDFLQEMRDVWFKEGDQAAYDLGAKLLRELEAEQEKLGNQAFAIMALGKYLQDKSGVTPNSSDAESELDVIEAHERPRLIIEAANEVVDSQQDDWPSTPDSNLVKVQDVLEQLRSKGLDLGVKQPLAVIGTVLTSADDFRKVARNTFEHVPQPNTVEIEDIPW